MLKSILVHCVIATRFLTAFLRNNLVLMAHSFFGVTVFAYYKVIIEDVVAWMTPCLCVIVTDLIFGIRAAVRRRERITFSKAARNTISKILAYTCWTVFAVGIGHNTDSLTVTRVTMFIILGIEGCSAIGNYLETKGWNFKAAGLQTIAGKLIGKWLGIDVDGKELIEPNRRGCGEVTEEETNEKQ